MAAKNTLFADCATMLLRRALNEGFALTIAVTRDGARADGVDLDGAVIELTSRGNQLALPLAPVEAVVPLERPAPVEAPAVDPLAPGQRVMRAGDAVFEARSDGMLTWVVERVDGALVHLACDARTQTVARADIRLDSADLWCLASPFDRPEVGDCIELDGRSVEVMGTDRDGFVWRAVDRDGPGDDEGETMWSDAKLVAVDVWVTPATYAPAAVEEPPIEAAPAAKKTRAKNARAPKVASTEPAAPVPHRLEAVTEADEIAHRGEHSLIGLIGREWRTLATRSKDETLPEWQVRCTTASKAVRVRVYDRGAHCTWDSLDGAREGHIQGNP
jgi:hypothetical protein